MVYTYTACYSYRTGVSCKHNTRTERKHSRLTETTEGLFIFFCDASSFQLGCGLLSPEIFSATKLEHHRTKEDERDLQEHSDSWPVRLETLHDVEAKENPGSSNEWAKGQQEPKKQPHSGTCLSQASISVWFPTDLTIRYGVNNKKGQGCYSSWSVVGMIEVFIVWVESRSINHHPPAREEHHSRDNGCHKISPLPKFDAVTLGYRAVIKESRHPACVVGSHSNDKPTPN